MRISTRWVKFPAGPYRGNIRQNESDGSFWGAHHACRLQNSGGGFLSSLQLCGLPCTWWLYRRLQRPCCSVPPAWKVKERLTVISPVLHACWGYGLSDPKCQRFKFRLSPDDGQHSFFCLLSSQYADLFSKLDYLLKSKALINSAILSATGAVNISYHAPINLPTEINNI